MQLKQNNSKFALVLVAFLVPFVSIAQGDVDEFTLRSIPLGIAYSGTVVIVIAAMRLGFLLGRRRKDKLGSTTDPAVIPVSGALMGLLAFMLAFTFNFSMNRFETRKTLYLEQVNAIEAYYRRADLFPEKYQTPIQAELVKYVDARIEAIRGSDRTSNMINRSYEIQNNLWKITEEMYNDPSLPTILFNMSANALTDVVTVHNKRVTITTIYHLPTALWGVLYCLMTMAMMGMGYLFGMDSKMNWVMVTILAFSFSAVVIMISDLDRSGSGEPSIISYSRQAMIDLRGRMGP